jgi:hypothetical protein
VILGRLWLFLFLRQAKSRVGSWDADAMMAGGTPREDI